MQKVSGFDPFQYSYQIHDLIETPSIKTNRLKKEIKYAEK